MKKFVTVRDVRAHVARASHYGDAGRLVAGLLVTLALAVISFLTWWLLEDSWLKFSALLWAFIYSIIATNLVPALSSQRFSPGIELASGRMLRWSIALLGLTVSASVWTRLGTTGLIIVLLNLLFAFLFGILFCRYVLKMSGALSILLGVGTCVCGASAIAATGPALRAKGEEMGVSLAVVTLFGLAAMFVYPLLYSGLLGPLLQSDPLAYGMWVGMGIHETVQVITAASQIEGAAAIALSAKFIRIFMIGPMVLASMFVFRRFSAGSMMKELKPSVPWFAVIFVIFTFIHLGIELSAAGEVWSSLNNSYLKPAVSFLLAWSFAGIGLKVKVSAIRAIGLKSFLGGIVVALAAGITALMLVSHIWLP